jgi:hypothetical protein
MERTPQTPDPSKVLRINERHKIQLVVYIRFQVLPKALTGGLPASFTKELRFSR